MFLLAELLGSGFLGIGGFDRLGLIGAHSSIDVAIRVFDVGVFPQLGEVGAERGLQFLVVESVLNMWKSVLQRRDAGLLGSSSRRSSAGRSMSCRLRTTSRNLPSPFDVPDNRWKR